MDLKFLPQISKWSSFDILVNATLLLSIIWIIKYFITRKRLPPGPWGLPIVGHLFFLPSPMHWKLIEWAKKYGSVYRIQLGSWPTVVISDYEIIKEALVRQSEDFAGRPDYITFRPFDGHYSVVFGDYSPYYKGQRAIGLKALSLFTVKRLEDLELKVVDEADTVISELVAAEGPVCPKPSLHVATTAVIYSLCYEDGASSRDNKAFNDVLQKMPELDGFIFGSLLNFMPWLRFFQRGTVKRFIELYEGYYDVLVTAYNNTKTTWQPSEPRNLSDALQDVAAETDKQSGFTEARGLRLVADFIGAGQGTIQLFLQWALLYLVKYPEIQLQLQQEIDRELGDSRAPSYQDRDRFPLCEAFFFETWRHSMAIQLIPHSTTRDCKFRGWDIKKNTSIIFSLASVFRDPNIWEKANDFNPMRFIDPDSGHLNSKLTEYVALFGMGKRRCMGEFTGRVTSFIFFVRLLQRCKFSKVEGEDYDTRITFNNSIKLIAKTRNA